MAATYSPVLQAQELYNVARGKPCRFSDHGVRQGDPSKLVDGINGNFDQSAVILNSTDSFWEVDLGEETVVEEVLIMMHRYALDKEQGCKLLFFSSNRILVRKYSTVSYGGLFYWSLGIPVTGCRYVRIRTQGSLGLPMEEVEVYGPRSFRQSPQSREEGNQSPSLSNPEPMKTGDRQLSLVVTYFEMDPGERRTEVDHTLQRNLQNPHIAEIHLLLESKVPCPSANSSDPNAPVLMVPFVHPKLVVFCLNQQPEYRDFFLHANAYLSNRLVIVSNGDIVFTDSLRHMSTSIPVNSTKAHIISRWPMNCAQATVPEINRCLTIYPSYDAFIFRAPVPESAVNNMTFFMNRKFAEHAAARALMEALQLSNPCHDVITLHNHCSNIREWQISGERVDGKAERFPGRALDENEISFD